MKQENTSKKQSKLLAVPKTLLRWAARMFWGSSKSLANELGEEEIQSPTKMMVQSFFRRKLAVTALVILVCMFLFVFIGPIFFPLDLSYINNSMKNTAPNFTYLSVPRELQKAGIKQIASYSSFTVGLSNDGKVYTWGYTKNPVSGYDISKIPEEVQNQKVIAIGAGFDHAIAVTEDGRVYGWGQSDMGQHGDNSYVTTALLMKEVLPEGNKIDPANFEKLICGYQSSVIIMKDGTAYAWGNKSFMNNIDWFRARNDIVDVAFSSSYIVAVLEDGSFSIGPMRYYEYANGDRSKKINKYINGRKVVAITSTPKSICLLLEDGTPVLSGDISDELKVFPTLQNGEKIIEISGGSDFYSCVTDQGRVYSFGKNAFHQTDAPDGTIGASKIYTGCYQSYAVDENGKLADKWGHRGHLFGTDEYGRDVFARIINGGRMTMTIGAVSVIISTVIAIIVGCISGYFGGWIDMLLMRITEIVSAIPFLPFAMMLSIILARRNTIFGIEITEMTRIFIIMLILGVLSWTGLARMIRGQVLAEREKEFVLAAKAMGVKESKIAFSHILKNVISVILVSVTLDFASCMLTESSLSYLGFGVALPRPTWGNMLNGCNDAVVIENYWWRWAFAAIFLGIATICINIIGDTLRDILDPRSGNER